MKRHLIFALLLLAFPVFGQTPDAIWNSLMGGNRAYVAGRLTYDNLVQSREKTAKGQNPPVTVLSCSDSRVPAELIFNRSIDQLFVIRAAGNIAGKIGIASIEYAIANGWTKMIVVLGHGECGAVKAALEKSDPPSPNLVALLDRIRPSLAGIDRNPKDLATVRRATDANARASAAYLLANSKIIHDAVQSGKVALVVAYYDLSTGKVERIH